MQCTWGRGACGVVQYGYSAVRRDAYLKGSRMTTDASATEVSPEVLEYLREHQTMTLATSSISGLPHAATFLYVNDGLTLYFCTLPDTTTARQIERNPAVAFTIDEYNPDWRKTKGIQGSG